MLLRAGGIRGSSAEAQTDSKNNQVDTPSALTWNQQRNMANNAVYRDQSKLDYLPAFNDTIVGRIDKISLAVAAIVGVFGILYFSLAPAAMSTEVKIGSEQLSGYTCNMIASVTRQTVFLSDFKESSVVTPAESRAMISKFNSEIEAFAMSSGSVPLLGRYYGGSGIQWPFQLSNIELKYDNTLFDTHDDCIKAARGQPTICTLRAVSHPLNSMDIGPGDPQTGARNSTVSCNSEIRCSSLKGTVTNIDDKYYFGQLFINQALLANPAVGQCNNQANVSLCTNIISNCASLERFRAGFEDLARKFVFTPEALCQPFVKNPPYICTKSLPPSVPSILSQALAFFTSALAAAKTALAFSTKMRHKYHNKAPSNDDGGPGTNCDVKAPEGASKPPDISVEMRSFKEEPFDKGSSSRFDRIQTQMNRFEAELADILHALSSGRGMQDGPSAMRPPPDPQEVAASDADVSQAPHRAQARVIGALAPERFRAKLLAPRASAQQGSHAGNPPNVSLPDALEIPQTPPRGRSRSRGGYAGNDGSRDA